jgi:hypothetical protein
MDERHVTLLDGMHFKHQVAGGKALHHQAGGGFEADVFGQWHQLADRCDHLLRITAWHVIPGHPIAGCHVCNTGPDGQNHPSALRAQRQRQRAGGAEASARAGIHEIHPGGHDLDQCLPRPRPGQ